MVLKRFSCWWFPWLIGPLVLDLQLQSYGYNPNFPECFMTFLAGFCRSPGSYCSHFGNHLFKNPFPSSLTENESKFTSKSKFFAHLGCNTNKQNQNQNTPKSLSWASCAVNSAVQHFWFYLKGQCKLFWPQDMKSIRRRMIHLSIGKISGRLRAEETSTPVRYLAICCWYNTQNYALLTVQPVALKVTLWLVITLDTAL